MFRSFVFAVVLSSVVGFEADPKHAKVVSSAKKGTYHDVQPARYPVYMSHPYPIHVEKGMHYSEEHLPYDSQPVYEEGMAHSRVITTISRDDEEGYEEKVVRSPVILAVSDRSFIERMPYPLKKGLLFAEPCAEHEQPHFGEEFYHSVKPGGKIGFDIHQKPSENRKSKDLQSKTEKTILSIEQNIPYAGGPFHGEGSVQHRETFQSPIIIAEEKPGYKYVRHLVGAGVLPVGRQFHVIILEEEEEAPADKTLTKEREGNPEDKRPTSEEPPKVSEDESKPSNKGPANDEKSKEKEAEEVIKKPNETKFDEGQDMENSGTRDAKNKETQATGKEKASDSGSTSGYDMTDTKKEDVGEVEEVEGYDVEGKIDIKMKT